MVNKNNKQMLLLKKLVHQGCSSNWSRSVVGFDGMASRLYVAKDIYLYLKRTK
jgi:hypothetical protein